MTVPQVITAIPLVLVAAFAVTVAVRWFSPKRHPDMHFAYLVVQTVCFLITKLFYRTQVVGVEHVPATGATILIANHVSYADVVVLGTYCPRPIRFLSWDGFEKTWVTRAIMRTMNTIPVSPLRAREAIKSACASLENGELICIFPEGHLTRTGALNAFRAGYEMIAKKSGAPVLPAYVDGLWGSIFSHKHGEPFRQYPGCRPRRLSLRFGPMLTDTAMYRARNALLDLGADAFAARDEMESHIAAEVVASCCAHPGRIALIDRAGARTEFTFARTLAVAKVLADRIAEIAPEPRIGLILPPGIPGTVANLACLLAGKIPVNLNFTLGRAALEHCFAKSGVTTVFTVDAFRAKVSEKLDVPWPEKTVDVLAMMKSLDKKRIVAAEAAVRLLPAAWLVRLWGVPTAGGDKEAALLFTSGSAGTPKGVPLTHRNILANGEQIFESGIVPSSGRLLANLPIFHSFGHTVCLWFALTRGVTCVCLPSPLDAKKNLEAIREEKVNTLIGTPTFYRGYLKKADDAGKPPSLERVIAGAEKTPAGFAEEWETRMGGQYYEGYGATETSPVVAVNVPDTEDDEAPGGVRAGRKAGSVGRLVVGMSARVIDPITGEPSDFGQTGLLSVRGANVFGGYLDDPKKTAEALRDGWYATGDLVRIDDEGFLYIQGRLARFSKIGGEMIPHGAVEEAVIKALGLPTDGDHTIAVSERSCPKKGEELVLITTVDIDGDALRKQLADGGLANLWIPRVFKRVPAIPVLATGKLDIQALKKLAGECE